MSNFKNKREIYEHLVNGGKIKGTTNDYLYLNSDGALVDSEGKVKNYEFYQPTAWRKYLEPKKVTLYRHTLKYASGYIESQPWSSDEKYLYIPKDVKLLKTETREIEVDDE